MTTGGQMSRRRALVGGGVIAAGALAGSGRGLLELLPWAGDDPDVLRRSSAGSHLGERFRVERGDGTTVSIVLASVEGLGGTSVDNPEGQFAARFEAAAGTGLEQQTYAMRSWRFGAVQLFLSPIHDDGDVVDRYEALINRPKGLTV